MTTLAIVTGNGKTVTLSHTRTLGGAAPYRVMVSYQGEEHLNFTETRATKALAMQCFNCWKQLTH